MEWLILLGLVVALVFFALSQKAGRERSSNQFPYEPQEAVFTPAERSFFGVLSQAVGDNAVVLGKMRIADVLRPIKGLDGKDWRRAFNRISSKHFDYIICSPDTLSVIAVVELDDRSHLAKKRQRRDEFVQGACSAAGVTLHRVKVQAAYNVATVREMIFPPESEPEAEKAPPVVEHARREPAPAQIKPLEQSLVCPKCSSDLVKRVANKGKHKGTQFMACSAFPKCRYIEMPKG